MGFTWVLMVAVVALAGATCLYSLVMAQHFHARLALLQKRIDLIDSDTQMRLGMFGARVNELEQRLRKYEACGTRAGHEDS